jgi:hypothetical protein
MRVVLVGIAFLAVCFVVNLVYDILHKPTEVFGLIPGESIVSRFHPMLYFMRRSFGNTPPPPFRLSCWLRSPRWKAPAIPLQGPIGDGV